MPKITIEDDENTPPKPKADLPAMLDAELAKYMAASKDFSQDFITPLLSTLKYKVALGLNDKETLKLEQLSNAQLAVVLATAFCDPNPEAYQKFFNAHKTINGASSIALAHMASIIMILQKLKTSPETDENIINAARIVKEGKNPTVFNDRFSNIKSRFKDVVEKVEAHLPRTQTPAARNPGFFSDNQ